MSKNSKRNRHTGHLNAFKKRVIKAGKHLQEASGRVYYTAQLASRNVRNAEGKITGVVPRYCTVRTL